jgi:predicted dehydrogenase
MIQVLVAGLGNMGMSHALAYHKNPDFEIVSIVNRSRVDLPPELQSYPYFPEFHAALDKAKPDLAAICKIGRAHV